MASAWSWVQTASGGVFCRIAKADSGLRSPHIWRFPTTNSNPFTGSAPERNTVRPGLLAKTVLVQDPWRSSISRIACSSRSRCGFTVQRTAPRFFVGTRTTKANPLISDHQGQAPRWLCVSQVHRPGLRSFPCQPRGKCHLGRTAGEGCPPRNHRDPGLEEAVSRGSHRG